MISCRTLPTRRFLASTLQYPPKSNTPRLRTRGVLFLALSLCPVACAQRIGDLYASDATVKGGVRYTASGLEIDNGSVITAGQHSASVRLTRGGQVRICPGTNLTVNSSPKGQELMFAISAGSLEGEYDLPGTADAILTPDFRILISGPAKVDVSITARPNGDACVRSRGDGSYVIVSELMGDDFYRVHPNEQAVFHPGNVKRPELNDAINCGCPAPSPVQQAEVAPAAPPQTTPAQTTTAPIPESKLSLPPTPEPAAPPAPNPKTPTPEQKAALAAVVNEPAVAATASAAASLPKEPSSQVAVQVDAPMVFRGSGARQDPDVTATLARVHIERLPWPQTPTVSPEHPSASPSKAKAQNGQKKGFFRRFISALFGQGSPQ